MRRLTIFLTFLGISLSAVPAFSQNDVITTIAGGGPNNLQALISNIDQTTSVAVDTSGNLYIASPEQNRIFRVDNATKVLTVLAGNGTPGYAGDGGPATQAALHSPEAVVLDATGNIFIADTQNNVIRKVDLTGKITTVAGTGASGFGGDGGPAIGATLARPFGLGFDLAGNLYFADIDNNRVRRVDAGGTITTVAGNGQADFSGDGGPAVVASISHPMSVALDSSGNLFISDSGNHRVRKVNVQGVITTYAGNGGVSSSCTNSGIAISGLATSLSLSDRTGVAVDASGNLLIADTDAGCVRQVNLAGVMTTVAGSGNFAFTGDTGPALAASLNGPLGVAMDSAGNLFIADTGNLRVREVSAVGSIINTVAGNGLTFSGDTFAAVNASLDSAQGIAVDASGNIYVADSNDNLIRKVDAAGIITTVAGNGCFGYSVGDPPLCDKPGDVTAGDGVLAVNASLAGPAAIAVDGSGSLFIADASNHRIREVSAAGTITTIAGDGTAGFAGEGVLATNAELNFPSGVAVDASGNFYIADTDNHRIRKVDAAGTITTFAGTGTPGFAGDGALATAALLNFPSGVALDSASKNLYIADLSNQRVRIVNLQTQIINTVAGNGSSGFSGDSGAALSASFNFPTALALDSTGNLFVADFGNQRVRRVDAATQTIITVAGNGNIGFSGDGGVANLASLANPSGVAADASGNLLIADTFNNRVRKVTAPIVPFISLSASKFAFANQVVGTASASQPLTITNAGNAPLIISNISIVTNLGTASPDFTETDNCASPLAVSATCKVNLVFNPTAPGPLTATLTLTDNAASSPQTIPLSGTGTTSLIAISQTSLVFGNQGVGSTSAFLTLAVTSTGSGPLTINNVTASGDFAQTNNCGASVPSLTTCTISVTFTPTATGARTGTLSISDSDPSSPQTVALSGTGVPAYTLIADRTLATIIKGTGSTTFNFSATSQFNFTTDITLSCSGNSPATCNFNPPSIAVGQNSVLTVSNLSAVTGNSLNFTVTGTNGTQTSSLAMTVMVADFSLSAAPTSASVTAGQVASYTLTIQPSGGFNQLVSLSCTGAPLAATCSVAPNSVAPDGTHPVSTTVSVTTSAIAPAVVMPHGPGGAPGPNRFEWLLFLTAAVGTLMFAGRLRKPRYLLAGIMLMILTWAACGGGSQLPLLRGTPAGSYTLSVTANSGSLSHSTNLSLTVH